MTRRIAVLLILAGLLALPWIFTGDYHQRLFIVCGLNVMLALGLNLVMGYAGQLSLGHIAFFGIGAYTCALLVMKAHWPFWLGLVGGAVLALVCGAVLGLFALRLRGHYLAIATLGFGVMVYQLLINWIDLTRGPLGLTSIPYPDPINLGFTRLDFGDRRTYYYLVLAFALPTYVVVHRLANSRVGDALLAVREDEISAQTLGINPLTNKVLAFTVGAAFAGLAGGLYAHYLGILAPESFFYPESFNILAMVVIGGLGSLPGSAVGAILFTLAPEYLRFVPKLGVVDLAAYRIPIFGLAVLAVMLFFPAGLAGLGRRIARRFGVRAREPVGGALTHPPSDDANTDTAEGSPPVAAGTLH
jgi:branched-chain amino acid transport system permease protein